MGEERGGGNKHKVEEEEGRAKGEDGEGRGGEEQGVGGRGGSREGHRKGAPP